MKPIYLIFILLCLTGCSKTEPSTSIADSVNKNITTIQKDINKSNLTTEEKQSFNTRLDTVKAEVKNVVLACETEKAVLKQKNTTLRIVLLFLFFLVVGLVYLIIKRK